MANFNNRRQNASLTKNQAGGVAYKESTKTELVTLMLTSFLSGNKHYESNEDVMKRFSSLASKLLSEDKSFLAKASIYARDKYAMRSISHLATATILEDIVKGGWTNEELGMCKRYLSKVVMRPDDITESIACYSSQPSAYKSAKGRVQLPNVAKKGFSSALGKFDEYSLAKYRCEDKEVSLLDAVRMIRPKPTEKNKSALTKLFEGTLKNKDTWEAKQSQAGKTENKVEAKKEAWSEFLAKGERIEYFALLRNLRNILVECSTEDIARACELLTNEKLVKRSKVLPFRFLSAYKAIQEADVKSNVRKNKILRALNRAIELSLSNVPKLEGDTAILLDISGSMSSQISSDGTIPVRGIANVIAAVLYKANDADVILFNGSAEYLNNVNPSDSVMTIANNIPCYGGTDMDAPFNEMGKEKYDNVIVLSDMQAWMSNPWTATTKTAFNKWKKRSGSENCKLFSYDLSGNGTLQFPEDNVYLLTGWSDHSLEIMGKMAEDKKYLIHEIENVEI